MLDLLSGLPDVSMEEYFLLGLDQSCAEQRASPAPGPGTPEPMKTDVSDRCRKKAKTAKTQAAARRRHTKNTEGPPSLPALGFVKKVSTMAEGPRYYLSLIHI